MIDRAPGMQQWITTIDRASKARLNMFFFPYAGGGTAMFRQWQDQLPEHVRACFVHLPGREHRLSEPLYTQLDELIEALVPAMQPHLDLRFVFFGHCMGALMSFELARALRKQGLAEPVQLFLSGYQAPHRQKNSEMLSLMYNEGTAQRVDKRTGLPEWMLYSERRLQNSLPALRADFAMCETYTYRSEMALNCPITVFGGDEDGYVNLEDLLAWKLHTQGAFAFHQFAGDHLYLHTAYPMLFLALRQQLNALMKDL